MKIEDIEKNVILKQTFDFSLEIIDYCKLMDLDRNYIISNQLLKSGTSIGANCFEAQNAESKADFIHKFEIAAKEANETQYWLFLCNFSKHFKNCDQLIVKLESINRILNNIISSSKKGNAK